jgi:hypothetical protein
MTESPALTILESIVTTTGVLAGLLIVVLALIPDRKRRKLELLYTMSSDLEDKKFDPQNNITDVERKIADIRILNRLLKERTLNIHIRNKNA